jgi:CDP-paratose 2-epimerase
MASETGQAFNIGGGPGNTVSLLELLDLIAELLGHKPQIQFDAWRTGDQRYYVSDTGKFQRATGWRPRLTVQEGLDRLHRWLVDSKSKEAAVIGSISDAGAQARKAAGAER